MKLSAENVRAVFFTCLFEKDEPKDNPVIAEGIMKKIGFHPVRIKENEDAIFSMLNQLPDSFKKSGGGGMSFLNACLDSEENQWADLHETMEQLFCLGMAIGKVEYLMSREMWGVLPGGMPYLVVNDSALVDAT